MQERTSGIGWTDEQTELARRLIEKNASPQRFRVELGRSKAAAFARVRYAEDPVAESIRRGRSPKQKGVVLNPERGKAPAHLFEETRHRLGAARSLTAMICGDPVFSQSALGKKTQGAQE